MLNSLLLLAAATPMQPIYGVARANDGDSLTIGSTRIRLFGIDAPELGQSCKRAGVAWSCGEEAADRLSRLVTGREIRCNPVSTDQYDRLVARCSVVGTDVNRTMVASGFAVAFRKYSTDYVSAEESAKLAKRGIWSGTFDMPQDVRAAQRDEPKAPTRRASAGGAPRPVKNERRVGPCVIKGNHSRRGTWIYHLPGMPYYAQTRAEQMFCTEAEAQAAGYRRAIVR
jgi:endonuclease YncB( thermonuclease family)